MNSAVAQLTDRELDALWSRDEPDLVLDPDVGTLTPAKSGASEPRRGTSIATGIGKAVASAAPVAGSVLLSSIEAAARWD